MNTKRRETLNFLLLQCTKELTRLAGLWWCFWSLKLVKHDVFEKIKLP